MVDFIQKSIKFNENLHGRLRNIILGGNSKFIILSIYNKISIYVFENNESKKICEILGKDKIKNIKMNQKYENIFLTVSFEEVNIFEITKITNSYKCEEKIKIITKDNLNFAKFSEYNEKILGTLSNDKIIRLWNIDLKYNYLTIKYKSLFVVDLLFNKNNNLILIQLRDIKQHYFIYLYDILYGTKIKKIKERNAEDTIFELSNSDFLNNLLVTEKYIEIMDLENEKIKDKILELNFGVCYDIFFFKKTQLLFLFYWNNFIIVNIKNLEIIFKHEIFLDNIFANYCTKDNTIIFLSFDNNFNIISLKFEKITIFDIILEELNSNNLFSKNHRTIFVKPNLSFENSIIEKCKIKRKKYLEIEDIIKALEKNYRISLEKKKEIVNKKLKEYNNYNNSINECYLFLIKLLILDNTNKELLKIYLKFLKENDETINNMYKNIEDFFNEYSNYNVAFTKEELQIHFGISKKMSEKEEFLNLLRSIIGINNNFEFIDLFNKYKEFNLGRFNQGIEYDNKELYWFRNKSLVILALLEMKYDSLDLMKYSIDKILNKKYFENVNILKNNKYITLLTLLIIIPLQEDYCDDNLKLFESLLQNNSMNITSYNESQILNLNNNYRLTEYIKAFEIYNQTIKLSKIKNFLKKIFCSNVFKEAFQILYPYYIYFPFQTEKDAENYINKYIHFVVFYSSESNGFTDNLTLETYIFLEPKEFKINKKIDKKQSELIEKILFSSGIVVTNFHELNHNLYNILFYHENRNVTLYTSRKEGKKEIEVGREMEFLLFGKKVPQINIKEALYILNEDNYNKSIIQFKDDFEKLYTQDENKDDIIIKGEFKEYVLNDNILNDKRNFNYIQLEEEFDSPYIESFDDNDVLGRGINFNLKNI